MNYLRGAVNAISVPYQYYKDINPSTLTGAIDVIVIQRPSGDGGSELACSPFHVRFGKWQVLRPIDKKVSVSVNGNVIPYSMKIGEAGEAFFVFETDADVPTDLITSPILSPVLTGADRDVDVVKPEIGSGPSRGAGPRREDTSAPVEPPHTLEPDFLDLDGASTEQELAKPPNITNITPRQGHVRPAYIDKFPTSISQPRINLPSPPLTPTLPPHGHTQSMDIQDQQVDAALKSVGKQSHPPKVEYRKDIALDVEGYHAHGRERSDRTIRPTNEDPPSPHSHASDSPQDHHIPSTSAFEFPSFRATSEPPPDLEDRHEHSSPSLDQDHSPSSSSVPSGESPRQEYSWEWGAFPQRSPLSPSFSRDVRFDNPSSRLRNKGKGREVEVDHKELDDVTRTRTRSVPPAAKGVPRRKRRHTIVSDEYGTDGSSDGGYPDRGLVEILDFGNGGKLDTSDEDPTRFILSINDKRITFELSLVDAKDRSPEPLSEPEEIGDGELESHHRRYPHRRKRFLDCASEMEAAELFAHGKVDYHTFLRDESLVNDPRLVVRWAGEQYITREDGSPLMQALVQWRQAALSREARSADHRCLSPPPKEESHGTVGEQTPERQNHSRSKSEPPEKPPSKPSSSWSQWWSRGRRTTKMDNEVGLGEPRELAATKADRLALRSTSSAPAEESTLAAKKVRAKDVQPASSAPALPSTPILSPERPSTPVTETKRRYAKTLRLTSDQLKTLNLKPGPNTITFSLTSTGAVACTARIFLWDSSDLIVVSDIDGTITKSDGLGHVFAMIGRDWTHVGVAKLYTDIVRNGYKIMYLTSRAIGQADSTRYYLKGIKQNNYQLPEGPVIMSPDRLMASLHREVIMRKPELFKMACLRDIQRLFGDASRNPFYAGFGNRITDALSYRSVNVPSARIFTIDSTGEVKMELLELAGYKSSYIHMTDLVDQMFPPIHRKWAPEFTDFNYWKPPVQDFPLPDLSPPSPALSARSDTSNQSALARLRNFSLVGNRQSSKVYASTRGNSSSPPAVNGFNSSSAESDSRNGQALQMSSLERLSSTLVSSVSSGSWKRSISPASFSSTSYEDSESEEGEGEGAMDGEGKKRRRERRRSMTSMPGTLDDRHFEFDDDEEEVRYEVGSVATGDEGELDHMVGDAEDGDFDEDLLAAGEMKDVPFL